MPTQLSNHSSIPDLTRRAETQQQAHWLLLAACSFAAVSAALDSRLWHAVGFTAIAAAVLLRALRLTEESQAWRWLANALLAFSIALYALRLFLRLSSGAA
jgi:hypothetical protein